MGYVVEWTDPSGVARREEVDGEAIAVEGGILYVSRDGKPVAVYSATAGWTVREK